MVLVMWLVYLYLYVVLMLVQLSWLTGGVLALTVLLVQPPPYTFYHFHKDDKDIEI